MALRLSPEPGRAASIDKLPAVGKRRRPPDALSIALPEITVPDPADKEAAALAFRQVMGQFATGVAVVSLGGGAAGVLAMTINSFVSLSLDPMLVSWSIKNTSSQFAAFADAERFAISILAEDQQALARRYAARGDSALMIADFEDSGGQPVIRGALAHVVCRRHALYPAGDHTLILGEVTDMQQAAPARRPLLFFGGRFGGLGG